MRQKTVDAGVAFANLARSCRIGLKFELLPERRSARFAPQSGQKSLMRDQLLPICDLHRQRDLIDHSTHDFDRGHPLGWLARRP